MEIPILYESKWLLAVNKPAGLVVEHSPSHPSVEDWAVHYLKKKEPKPFIGIIHRLDRTVSGVLLLAKRRAALKDLNKQFLQRRVEKIYLARVEHAPPKDQDTLIHWLRKDLKLKQAKIFEHPVPDAVECKLTYKTLTQDEAGAILEIHLHSGKFHQIRAQLTAIGCPILGDAKYGATRPWQPEAIALHAWKLSFTDPLTNQAVHLKTPLPPFFPGE